jgi:hypothetical protein
MPAEREAREPVPRATKITAQSGRSQIAPLRVARLDQFELPFAMPAFALFAKDRFIDRGGVPNRPEVSPHAFV